MLKDLHELHAKYYNRLLYYKGMPCILDERGSNQMLSGFFSVRRICKEMPTDASIWPIKKWLFFHYFCRFLGRSQRWPLYWKGRGRGEQIQKPSGKGKKCQISFLICFSNHTKSSACSSWLCWFAQTWRVVFGLPSLSGFQLTKITFGVTNEPRDLRFYFSVLANKFWAPRVLEVKTRTQAFDVWWFI